MGNRGPKDVEKRAGIANRGTKEVEGGRKYRKEGT